MTGGSGGPEGIGSSEVSGELEKYQGKYVDIGLDVTGNTDTTDDWEVFYATKDRIFLIAADYVPVEKLKTWGVIGESGALKENGFQQYSNRTYNVYWPSTPKTFLALPDLGVVMHNGYSLDTHNTNPNSIAVSHLLNTTAWEGIKNAASKKASIDFVIGGPTLEMWCAAWKEAIKDNTDNLVALEADPQTSGTGYNVKYNGTSKDWLYVTDDQSKAPASTKLDKYKTFFPHSAVHNNCSGYWLASPSAYGGGYLMYVGCSGRVDYDYYESYRLGLRPVVCLNSGVSLVESADTGGYTLS